MEGHAGRWEDGAPHRQRSPRPQPSHHGRGRATRRDGDGCNMSRPSPLSYNDHVLLGMYPSVTHPSPKAQAAYSIPLDGCTAYNSPPPRLMSRDNSDILRRGWTIEVATVDRLVTGLLHVPGRLRNPARQASDPVGRLGTIPDDTNTGLHRRKPP